MGEAVYKLKAKFKTPEAAKAANVLLTAFLTETEKAFWFWQDNRDSAMEHKAFWTAFKADYPNTYAFLKSFGKADANLGELAGQMSLVGQEDDVKNLKLKGDTITYESEVWHMATWVPFADYVRNHFKAENVTLGGGAGSE